MLFYYYSSLFNLLISFYFHGEILPSLMCDDNVNIVKI
jgi:hypothetical protein